MKRKKTSRKALRTRAEVKAVEYQQTSGAGVDTASTPATQGLGSVLLDGVHKNLSDRKLRYETEVKKIDQILAILNDSTRVRELRKLMDNLSQ